MPAVLPTPNTFLAPGPDTFANPIGVEQGAVYVITGPDGTRAVLNDPTDRDFVGYLTEPPSGLERAGVRESADLLPEADGGIHGAFRYDRLSFTLKGVITPALTARDVAAGETSDLTVWVRRQAKLMRATDAMLADAYLRWKPSYAPAVQVAFRQLQPTRITDRRPKSFLVAGVSEDAAVYGQDLKIAQVAPSSLTVAGLASPMTSPLSASAGTAGLLTITTLGTRPTWPVLTVYGPITNPTITSRRAGLSIVLNYALNAGDYLVLDTNPRQRTIKLNGAASRYSALVFALSSWWPLYPGDNDVVLGAASYSAGASLSVQYRDAWG